MLKMAVSRYRSQLDSQVCAREIDFIVGNLAGGKRMFDENASFGRRHLKMETPTGDFLWKE